MRRFSARPDIGGPPGPRLSSAMLIRILALPALVATWARLPVGQPRGAGRLRPAPHLRRGDGRLHVGPAPDGRQRGADCPGRSGLRAEAPLADPGVVGDLKLGHRLTRLRPRQSIGAGVPMRPSAGCAVTRYAPGASSMEKVPSAAEVTRATSVPPASVKTRTAPADRTLGAGRDRAGRADDGAGRPSGDGAAHAGGVGQRVAQSRLTSSTFASLPTA